MIKPSDIKIEDLPLEFQELAEKLGLDATVGLIEMRGGEFFYVPVIKSILLTARNRLIRSEFTGSNFRQLARKYSLSMTYIRKLIKVWIEDQKNV